MPTDREPCFDNRLGDSVTDRRHQLLTDAAALVTGDRAEVYGPPAVNFRRIAALHNTYLDLLAEARGDYTLEAHDVAVMAILTKIARLIHTPDHEDSYLDICGYGAAGYDAACKDDL
jgi:hypothetical protein